MFEGVSCEERVSNRFCPTGQASSFRPTFNVHLGRIGLNDLVLASVLGEFRIKIILTFCQCIMEVVSQICETTKICVLFWWHLCIVMEFCARMRV